MRGHINIIRCVCLVFLALIITMGAEAHDVAADTVAHRPTVGVVLCGGGAKGFAHIPILKKIEEAGIPIDYIGGTSIGSIIGGLYATGYDPDMMEKLTREQDWNTVIYDKIPAHLKPIEDKMESKNYIATFPFKNGKLKVATSVIDGIYVNLLMSRLMIPAYKIKDFSKLSVPFFCVATDVEHATQYEMTKGVLSRSVRASMAIPLFFTPIRLDGKLLVDGGMINNFPVRNMEEKNVDIIIGIDLEEKNIPADQIDNSLGLISNMLNLSSLEETNYGRTHCDVYIRPDLHGRGMLSFDDFDSIIQFGREAGEAMFPQLKRLGDSIHAIKDFKVVRPHVQPIDSIFVEDIQVVGVKKNHDNHVKDEFGKHLPCWFDLKEIEETILRLKATGYYSDLWYEIEDSTSGGPVLKIHCTEKSDRSFSFAIHYDNNYGIGALVNYSVKNIWNNMNRGTLSVDVNAAECPYARVRFSKRQGRIFRFGADAFVGYASIKQYQNQQITNTYSIQDNKLDIYGQIVQLSSQSFRFGLVGDHVHMRDLVGDAGLKKSYEFFTYFYVNYYLNTEDLAAFAKKGWNLNVTATCLLYNGVFSTSAKRPVWSVKGDVTKTLPVGEKHSIKVGATACSKIGVTPLPAPYRFYVGGQSKMKYLDNIISFNGLDFVSKSVNYLSFVETAWQWNFYKDLYSVVSCDFGYMNEKYDEWFKSNSFVIGYGLTVGLNTFAGPIEVSLMGSNESSNPVFFINVGFWF